ncbi:trypsin isoform X1 [Halyomorpha halys]|uniref:trypsin isoform X1 n=1 Tax=Halyomorpha halys TaxID=286706 RepID=UPI0034D2CBEF
MLVSVLLLWLLFSFVSGCGEPKSQSGKIVGGRGVDAKIYPWYVALVQARSEPSNLAVECGASLITKSHILTAAHCYRGIPAPAMKNAYKAVFVLENRCSGENSLIRRISRVTVHPNFNYNSLKNDIAIAQLESAVDFEPVCLPSTNSRSRGQGTIIGYGNLINNGQKFPCTLQEANVNVYSWNNCLKTGNYRDIANLPKTICAGFISGGVDTCNGDSGGPLLQINSSGNYFVKGITSFGHGCGIRNNPGVYTDVSKYIPWIRRNVGLAKTARQTTQKITYSIILAGVQRLMSISDQIRTGAASYLRMLKYCSNTLECPVSETNTSKHDSLYFFGS